MSTPRALRTDIQGLRAVAVVAVVLDHTIHWPSGGFLGVDVFFVISGFLITGLLLREVERTGRIDFRDFYVRRVKRILPLSLLVLGVTVVAARLTVNGARAAQIQVDALWAMAFGANVRFERAGTDYFQSQGPVSPLQHYWSLSVEEQFYFVWPALLAVLVAVTRRASTRSRRIVIGAVMGAGIAVSIVVALSTTASSPTGAYFSTATRAWELGVGALLAVLAPALATIPATVRTVLAWLGLAGIGVSLVVIDASAPIPIPGAVPPVLATAALVAAGTSGPVPRLPLLAARPVQHLGTLSYALYLWHFPVFILGAALLPDEPWAPAVLIGVGLALAAASHALIEVPAMRAPWPSTAEGRSARHREWTIWRRDVGPAARRAGLAVLVGATTISLVAAFVPGAPRVGPPAIPLTVGGATPTADANAGRSAKAGPAVTALQTEVRAALAASSWPTLDPTLDAVLDGSREGSSVLKCGEAEKRGLSQADCTWGPDGGTTAVLVGDSTAMHYLDSLVGVATAPGSRLRLQNRAMFACPFLDAKIQNDTAGILETCAAHNAATVEFLRASKPDVVLVTNSYQSLTDADTGSAITTARWSRGVDDILGSIGAGPRIVLLPSPPDDADIAACFTPRSTPPQCLTTTQTTWFDRFAGDSTAVEERKGVVVDTRPLLCLDDLCPAFVGTVPVKEDRVHLTTAFAKKIAPALGELLSQAGVPEATTP